MRIVDALPKSIISFIGCLNLQSLDEVNITIETCEFGRTETSGAAGGGWQTLTAPQGKYSFVNKIIDGITVTVNTVNINFKSPAFTASVQVSTEFSELQSASTALTHIYKFIFFSPDVSHTSGI